MLELMLAVMMSATPDPLVEVAISECRTAIKSPDRPMLMKVLDEEVKAGWPERMRGAILAAACRESGFSPKASGDCRSGVCMAQGLLQLWPWAERRYAIDRHNPIDSARVWARQIAKTVRKAKRKGCSRPWVVAWAWVASGPKGWGCDRAPRHLTQLKKMKRALRYKRIEDNETND
jgi:hypothetical protein